MTSDNNRLFNGINNANKIAHIRVNHNMIRFSDMKVYWVNKTVNYYMFIMSLCAMCLYVLAWCMTWPYMNVQCDWQVILWDCTM